MTDLVGEIVLDTAVLNNLADDLQSETEARNYALKFVDLLPSRLEDILTALDADDIPVSLNAVLSLKVNAHMVGARSMEQTCHALQRCLFSGDTAAARRHAHILPGDVDAFKDAMAEFLSGALH